MNECSFTIDGKAITCEKGRSILWAALANKIDIPHACYVPDIDPPVAECKVCVVEVGDRIVNACTEQVADGIVVISNTPELDRLRRKRLHFPG